jgi:hypothetical protein
MLPRRFNYTGASLDTITRLTMLYAIADTLGKAPASLPPMSDAQLWQSFKSLPSKPHYSSIPPEIRNQLNPGDFFAFEFGRWMNSSAFPEGGHFEEIEERASATAWAGKDAKDKELGAWFLLLLTPFLLKGLNHPQAARHAAFLGLDLTKTERSSTARLTDL